MLNGVRKSEPPVVGISYKVRKNSERPVQGGRLIGVLASLLGLLRVAMGRITAVLILPPLLKLWFAKLGWRFLFPDSGDVPCPWTLTADWATLATSVGASWSDWRARRQGYGGEQKKKWRSAPERGTAPAAPP